MIRLLRTRFEIVKDRFCWSSFAKLKVRIEILSGKAD